MTPPAAWHEASVLDLRGKKLATVRVPKNPLPPGLIMWGARHFLLTLPDGNYGEVKCYMVPLENMYAGASGSPAPPASEVKK